MMARVKTEQVGVYYRHVRNRLDADGNLDRYYDIAYRRNGKLIWEKVGWHSEGHTPASAAKIRAERIGEFRRRTTPLKSSQSAYSMVRIKTKHVGVYYRHAKNRFTVDGKPDKCYDITYKKDGKLIWEKVGWSSEGYTEGNAVEIRGTRIRETRHPEQFSPKTALPLKSDASNSDFTVDDAWQVFEEKWLPTLKSRYNIKNEYVVHIRPYFGKRKVASISTMEIETHKLALLQGKTGHKLKAGTVKIIMSNFRRILNKSCAWGFISVPNPVLGIQVRGADQKRERFLSEREVYILLDSLQSVSCVLYFIATISLYTGMRLHEIIQLRGQNIDIDAGIIYVDGKGGERVAYFSNGLKTLLSRILPQTPSELLFPSPKENKTYSRNYLSTLFSKTVNELGFNDGITDDQQKCVFHTLRHTFCSWLAQKGVPLFTIGQLVGHTTVQMTQRYAKLSPDSKREALKYIDAALSMKK